MAAHDFAIAGRLRFWAVNGGPMLPDYGALGDGAAGNFSDLHRYRGAAIPIGIAGGRATSLAFVVATYVDAASRGFGTMMYGNGRTETDAPALGSSRGRDGSCRSAPAGDSRITWEPCPTDISRLHAWGPPSGRQDPGRIGRWFRQRRIDPRRVHSGQQARKLAHTLSNGYLETISNINSEAISHTDPEALANPDTQTQPHAHAPRGTNTKPHRDAKAEADSFSDTAAPTTWDSTATPHSDAKTISDTH